MRKAIFILWIMFLVCSIQSCEKSDPEVPKPINIGTLIIDNKWVSETTSAVYNCVTDRQEYTFNSDGTGYRSSYLAKQDMMKRTDDAFTWYVADNKNIIMTFTDGGKIIFADAVVKADTISTIIGSTKLGLHRELTNKFDLDTSKGTYLTNRLAISTSPQNKDFLSFSNFSVTARTSKGFRMWASSAYPLTGQSWGIGRADAHLYIYAVCDSEDYTYSIFFEENKKPFKEKNLYKDALIYYFLIGEVSHTTSGTRSIVIYDKEYQFGY